MQAQVQVMNKLLDLGENDVRMAGVWGTGGIGKTTIAKAVYNSIAHKFEGCSFLANIRERSTSHEGLVGLQENLLSDILRVKNLKVNVDQGVTMIKEWLRRRKVLLVLDDVDDMEQLHSLVGACDWFGVGSRIIITTRDKQLLTAHGVNLIHEVKILDDDKALELFCWHAFKTNEPPLGDYVKLAKRALRYAQGLPLALKVLGSCLYGEDIDKWNAALEGFKSPTIQDVLKISYNALDDIVKEVFLDIACFFKGKSRNYVIETCELNTRYGIDVLIEKGLISVEGSYIQMHDLLEKMGKDIIEQESPTEPGGRSRLWFHNDVKHVLTNNTGTNKITGIMLNFPRKSYEIFLDTGRSFSKMKNLKIIMNYNVCLHGDFSFAEAFPNNLRVIDNTRNPYRSWPANFSPNALVVLNLPYSCLKQIGERFQHFKKLTYLNLERSEFLTEIPDLSSSLDLRYLNANGCTSLVEVHPSVGYLDKLEGLDFCYCCELTKFPNKVRLKSLKKFLLYGCIKLESFPEIVDKMESLTELDLGRTAIKELPASIGHLIGLEILRLSESAIKELPASIGNLIRLKELSLSESAIKEFPAPIEHLTALEKLNFTRTAIQKLPSSFGNFNALKELWLGGTAIEELPSSIGNLTALKGLDLQGCENLANLPQSIYGLQNMGYINLSRCPKLVTLPNNLISEVLSSAESLPLEVRTNANSPHDGDFVRPGVMYFEECNASNIDSLENFCCWSNLTIINLSKSDFVSLLVCISKCVNLWELDLRGCKRLKEIRAQLPASIARIDMADCISLKRFSTLSKILEDEDMQGISDMDLSNCHRLCDNLRLDVSKMAKILLNQMNRSERIIVKLPGSEVPEWFTFRNYFDDYDEGKFDYFDIDGRSAHYYELPIEIPWTFVLENTKLVLCAVWEITESFVSPCSLLFELYYYRLDRLEVSGGETGAGNVWLECIPLSFAHRQLSRSFGVTIVGKGLRIKSIGAHLAPISMSRDGDDDGKHINENELDDDGDEGDEV
ncbi:hypothetical protein GBA52_004158 [Prunus armeniaca]|nr:hypothetical protein GBA52_004158 [Prunus armeniaca]